MLRQPPAGPRPAAQPPGSEAQAASPMPLTTAGALRAQMSVGAGCTVLRVLWSCDPHAWLGEQPLFKRTEWQVWHVDIVRTATLPVSPQSRVRGLTVATLSLGGRQPGQRRQCWPGGDRGWRPVPPRSCSIRSAVTDVQSPVAQKPRGGFASGRPGPGGASGSRAGALVETPAESLCASDSGSRECRQATPAGARSQDGARGQACLAELGAETRRVRHTSPPQRSTPHSESNEGIKPPERPGGHGAGTRKPGATGERQSPVTASRVGVQEAQGVGPVDLGPELGVHAVVAPTPTHSRGAARLGDGAAGCRRFRVSEFFAALNSGWCPN